MRIRVDEDKAIVRFSSPKERDLFYTEIGNWDKKFKDKLEDLKIVLNFKYLPRTTYKNYVKIPK